MIDIESFISESIAAWPMAQANYEGLASIESKEVDMGDGLKVRVQYNPKRLVSTGAKMDAATLKQRPCFLCRHNRPEQQKYIEWRGYEILLNPFPIFPRHLTIAAAEHTPQSLTGRCLDMYLLAEQLPGYVVFFNGAKSGASAPDHMHFQAGNADFLPDVELHRLFKTIDIAGDDAHVVAAEMEKALQSLDPAMVNVLCKCVEGKIEAVIIPRKAHRPDFYGDLEGQMVISPASVDLGGVFITPRLQDFKKIDREIINELYKQLCF